MRLAVPALAALALAAWAPGASAAFIHDANGQTVQPYAEWAANSHAIAPNADVLLLVGDAAVGDLCPALRSCSQAPGTIGLRDALLMRSRETFLHELGHVFDYTMMNDDARHTFLRMMSTPARAWRSSSPNSPHEMFAQAYEMCAVLGQHYDPGNVDTAYGYYPSPRTYRRVCKLIYRVGVGD